MHRLGTLRNRKKTLKAFTELDAFPKIPENYQETSASGGSVTLVISLFIFILVVSEFWYYRAIEAKYSYEVDTDADSKIAINVDLTVAMQCDDLGVDVLDLSGSTIQLEDGIQLEPTYFELTEEQKVWMSMFKEFHYFFEGYRSLGEMDTFKRGMPTYLPPRKENDNKEESKPHDACRVHGSFEVNKVAGNFHLTAGKSILHPQGHAHLSALVPEQALNFSHRIDHLSFGARVPGHVNPLDSELQIGEKARLMYQYYIKIVPTTVKYISSSDAIKTNQYSVTQRSREISHTQGSHGIAGIFFKYDLSSILVRIKYQHRSILAFLVRLCGIIGGIFATSGMLHSLVGYIVDIALCRFGYKKLPQQESDIPPQATSTSSQPPILPAQANGPHLPPPSPNLTPGTATLPNAAELNVTFSSPAISAQDQSTA